MYIPCKIVEYIKPMTSLVFARGRIGDSLSLSGSILQLGQS